MPLFAFPGTTRLEFDWIAPNKPAAVNYTLLQIEEALARTEIISQAAQNVIQADVAERFETERDPEGRPWEELKRPAPDQVGILRLSTDLYEAATSDQSYVATPDGVFFRTDDLPDYWVFHEQPTGEGGQRIPRRRFIGLSADAERVIEGIGDMFMVEAISMAGALRPGRRAFRP